MNLTNEKDTPFCFLRVSVPFLLFLHEAERENTQRQREVYSIVVTGDDFLKVFSLYLFFFPLS